MSAAGQQQHPQQQHQHQSEALHRVQNYLLEGEEISYTLRFRPIGIVNWLKSKFGFGVTHWFVTDQRLVQETRIGGGFTFKDVPHAKISSIEYASKVSLTTIALGILIMLGGIGGFVATESVAALLIPIIIGLVVIGYAYWRRQQVLAIHASGGVTMALAISKGQQVDDFLWYLHAERQKQTA